MSVDQPQIAAPTAAPTVNRVVRWRYRTAVQAARMLNSAAPEPRGRHRSPVRAAVGPRAGQRHVR
jgi:hypothetical protein